MDTENNLNPEQKKIHELLEEAAKRHREIEQKIHPEKYGINITAEKEAGTKETENRMAAKEIPPVEKVKPVQMPAMTESTEDLKTIELTEKIRNKKSEKIDETMDPIESDPDIKASKTKDITEDETSKRNIGSLHSLAHNYSISTEVKSDSNVSGNKPETFEEITLRSEGEISEQKIILKEEPKVIEEIKSADLPRLQISVPPVIEAPPPIIEVFEQQEKTEITVIENPEVKPESIEIIDIADTPFITDEKNIITQVELGKEIIGVTDAPYKSDEIKIKNNEAADIVKIVDNTDIPYSSDDKKNISSDNLPEKEIIGTTDAPYIADKEIIGTSDIPYLPIEEKNITSEELIKSASLIDINKNEADEKTIDQFELDEEIESNEFLKSIDSSNSTVHEKPFITDFDMHLFSQGTFYKVYEKFGAHIVTKDNISGVQFTTWAPNAEAIFIIGEFNGWLENDEHKMLRLNDNGVWTGFVPGLKKGDTYKFSLKSNVHGEIKRKADPYAFRSEVRPKNASIIEDIDSYKWNDTDWVNKRKADSYKEQPMNIYEVHLGSWRRDWNNKEHPNEWGYLSYGTLAKEIVAYVKKMGYTHIELMPVMEHPLDISWGYQVTHYYAPTSRFGSPEDFMYFVDYCHQNDIGVILDWVPAHFPYDEHALAYFDGKQIYAYENVKRGIHKDWGTYIFDYGKPEVQNFLIGSALFWLEKYHADGLRVDAVASMLYLDYSRNQGEWEPNIHGGREHLEAIGFLKHLNEKVHEYHPGTVMIAEESTSWPGVSHKVSDGGLGFDMKWNMGWMNDILLYFSKDPVHRKFHQGKLTFSLWYAFSENFVLPVSHDEVVHGKKSLLEKMPGDNWQKFANLRLFLGFMMGHPGKKLNFMTTDIGQYREWNCEDSMEWNLLELDLNKKFNLYAEDINRLYKDYPSLFQVDFNSSGFHWIDFSDSLHSVLSFIRTSKDKTETLLFTFNMTPTIRTDYQVGVPEAGYWKEILNSDAGVYGGSDVGNMGGKHSENVPYKDWKQSIRLTLPPLAVNVYKLEKSV